MESLEASLTEPSNNGLGTDETLDALLQRVNRTDDGQESAMGTLSEIQHLAAKLDETEFVGNRSRLQLLLDICAADSTGLTLLKATELMLSTDAQESSPNLFDAFVRLLWTAISGNNANSTKQRDRRIAACESLIEIELVMPGSLEALVRIKEGQDRSPLAVCVLEERSHAFQAYIRLFLTILAQLPHDNLLLLEAARLSAVGLVVESLPLLSKWVRCDILLLVADLLSKTQDSNDAAAILYTLGQHAVEGLGYSSSAIGLVTLLTLEKMLSPTDAKSFLGRLAATTQQVIRDSMAPTELRMFACEVLPKIIVNAELLSIPLPTPFEPLDIAVASASACFDIVIARREKSDEVSKEALLDLCWFCEDFYRESVPRELSKAAFHLYRAFLSKFPESVDVVAGLLVQGAVLRGGSRFLVPLEKLLGLANENRHVYECLVISVANAVVDIPSPADTAGFFPIIEGALELMQSDRENDTSRCMSALERYVLNFIYKSAKWPEAMAFLRCCQIGLRALPTRSRSAVFYRRLVKLMRNKTCEPVLMDECDMVLRESKLTKNNISLNSERASNSCDNFDIATRPLRSKLDISTIALDQLIVLERCDLQSLFKSDENANELKVPLRVKWAGEETSLSIDELFGLEIHIVDSQPALSATFDESSRPFSVLCVPCMSKRYSTEHNLSLTLKPAFPAPVRISFRAMAFASSAGHSDADASVVEGPLQSITLDFEDWWMPTSDVDLASFSLTEHVTIVREQVEEDRVHQFLTESKAGKFFCRAENTDGEVSAWTAMVLVRPKFHLSFQMKYVQAQKRLIVRSEADHWVLLGYLDQIFSFGR